MGLDKENLKEDILTISMYACGTCETGIGEQCATCEIGKAKKELIEYINQLKNEDGE